MTILNKILLAKKTEVEKLKKQDIDRLINHKKVRTFSENILNSDKMGIIAEIKRSSPSKGPIHMDVDPVKQAQIYEASGAAAISVLTDTPFFNGTMDDLRAVRHAVDLPILCKDFIIDHIQIDHAKAAGANIILLIVAALEDDILAELYAYAKGLGLEVLTEVHTVDEMERALNLGADIIGINNRDLTTFTVSLNTTTRLASMVDHTNTILVSESGIKTKDDVLQISHAGAQAILVGETFMRADNVTAAFDELRIPLHSKGD